MCNVRVKIQVFCLKCGKALYSAYHYSYKIANKHLLQKIIFIGRDIFQCLLWLFISPWMNAHCIHPLWCKDQHCKGVNRGATKDYRGIELWLL